MDITGAVARPQRRWGTRVRQTHRWLAIIFTVTVVVTTVAVAQGNPAAWLVYSPLPPLAVLLFTGLNLWALPYIAKWRDRRRAVEK
jgi:hypothetical protein